MVKEAFEIKPFLTLCISFINNAKYFSSKSVTITLSRHSGWVDPAHSIVEVNNCIKFDENPSRSKGLIEWTRIV
jgi:hypothetical protein